MEDREKASLLKQIEELQFQLKQRESDLETYRSELVRTNGELERLIVDITKQVNIAGKIQKLITPTEYPSISGFEFSSKFVAGGRFGGDYFDIFEHQDKLRFGVIMACCSGYSTSALLLSVLLKFSAMLESRGGEIEVTVSNIVEELQQGMADSDQASFFYGYVDKRTYELKYIYIGDISAVLLNAETGQLEKLKQLSPPLSKNSELTVTSQIVSLNSRDRLVLCTQGLKEVKGVDGESFGVERFYKSLIAARAKSVHDLRNEILFRLQDYRSADHYERDVTVLVSEVKDRVIKLA